MLPVAALTGTAQPSELDLDTYLMQSVLESIGTTHNDFDRVLLWSTIKLTGIVLLNLSGRSLFSSLAQIDFLLCCIYSLSSF